MLRRKNCLFGFMLLLSVFFLALSGCGGGSGSGGDDNGDDSNNGGGFLRLPQKTIQGLGNGRISQNANMRSNLRLAMRSENGKEVPIIQDQ